MFFRAFILLILLQEFKTIMDMSCTSEHDPNVLYNKSCGTNVHQNKIGLLGVIFLPFEKPCFSEETF